MIKRCLFIGLSFWLFATHVHGTDTDGSDVNGGAEI